MEGKQGCAYEWRYLTFLDLLPVVDLLLLLLGVVEGED